MNEEELAKICNKSTSDCIKLAKQLKDAQQRIDKAIEHIETHQLCYQSQYKEMSGFDNHLLDILRGEDDGHK